MGLSSKLVSTYVTSQAFKLLVPRLILMKTNLRLVVSSTLAKYLDHLDHQFQVTQTEMIRGNQA